MERWWNCTCLVAVHALRDSGRVVRPPREKNAGALALPPPSADPGAAFPGPAAPGTTWNLAARFGAPDSQLSIPTALAHPMPPICIRTRGISAPAPHRHHTGASPYAHRR